jgi:hypothetical protein
MYPGEFEIWRVLENQAGVPFDPNRFDTVQAQDWNAMRSSLDRFQHALGLNPQGTAADVATRMSNIEAGFTNPEYHYQADFRYVYGYITEVATNRQLMDYQYHDLPSNSSMSIYPTIPVYGTDKVYRMTFRNNYYMSQGWTGSNFALIGVVDTAAPTVILQSGYVGGFILDDGQICFPEISVAFLVPANTEITPKLIFLESAAMIGTTYEDLEGSLLQLTIDDITNFWKG